MEVESVLVTGANRGIGFEFVKQLLRLPKPPHYVFATYRDEKRTQALEEVKEAYKQTQVVLIKMDIEKTNEIEKTKKKIVEESLVIRTKSFD
ncbi:c-factor [Caerostris extrusa]|uniref:C-factor n=1 Tax=Caerostris extrusa TaxID=172846 RepID=A0AAV4N2D2_CAEEX|nr:c-factor [Caerostris extrusa]